MFNFSIRQNFSKMQEVPVLQYSVALEPGVSHRVLLQDALRSLNLPRESSVKFIPSHSSRIAQPSQPVYEPRGDDSISASFNNAYTLSVDVKNGTRSFQRDMTMFGTCTVKDVSYHKSSHVTCTLIDDSRTQCCFEIPYCRELPDSSD